MMTPSNSDWAIGIDLGGTNLRGGVVAGAGRVIARDTVALGGDKSSSTVIAKIADLARGLQKKSPGAVRAAGCGVPGIVEAGRGAVISSPNLPAWGGIPIRDLLAEELGLPVAVDNDANFHALGEARFGAGQGHRNMVLLTLGSGIGGGIILGGEIFHGDEGFAGEVGHIVVEPGGARCGCGNRGCWERYAASQAFRLFAERMPAPDRERLLAAAAVPIEELTPERMARLADAGDAAAIELWGTFGKYLGIGIATILNVLGVSTFVIGGGIAQSFDRFAGAARESALAHTYAHHAAGLVISRGGLGDDAGIIGAAMAAIAAGS